MGIQPYVFIFIGRSGCGKGTQADLLMAHLKKTDPKREVVDLMTGKLFREFVQGGKYSNKLAKKINDEGGLQPEFLTISLWSNFFCGEMKPDIHLVMDGTPRKYSEALVLDTAVKFYGWTKPHVLYQNISREEAMRRLLARGRADDKPESINSRLDWFDTDVMKALSFFRDNPDYFYHDINGEQPIEEIHNIILQRVGLVK